MISNLDNIISIFRSKDDNKELSEEDLQRTLEDLVLIKATLEQIEIETANMKQLLDEPEKSENSFSDDSSGTETPVNDANNTVRDSIEMLKNNGMFTKPIVTSEKKRDYPPADSVRRKSKDLDKHRTPSFSSLRNSMTITPVPVSRRKSPPNHKLLSRKVSHQALLKKAEKKARNSSKQARKSDLDKPPTTIATPKVVSTLFATCRIISYDDKSHTLEIMEPIRGSEHGDGSEKPKIVVVVLANGQTALFTTKSGANILSIGESQ